MKFGMSGNETKNNLTRFLINHHPSRSFWTVPKLLYYHNNHTYYHTRQKENEPSQITQWR